METKLTRESSSSKASNSEFLAKKPHSPPPWASHLSCLPSHVFSFAHRPTPIQKWSLPNLPSNTEVWLKREGLAGIELGGNKFRKLEFLMADAVAQGADCVITIGFIQSSHCCATAVAAKYVNLDSYFILITSKVIVDQDPGLTGNLLVQRMIGAQIELVSADEFLEFGKETLTNILKEKLIKEGRRPYIIPTGGTNSLGIWGYIEAIREIEQQIQSGPGNIKFGDIVVACSSGGTAAGLSLGSSLSSLKARGLLDELEAGVNSRGIVEEQNADGLGYAINTSEELNLLKEIAVATGVILHPS
ncbi:putative D-cysteine desulfhydrase 1, mitochondrial isoform X2 [Prosopis cineraria]|uniref:putative D-cysteine desulfhydrase 1, mitochondrial isoform X2 n=1 Tax=Prosopis cineraria TaxID=364024 RepID=UPI0024107CEF|nr:putative D-cysteine desulfhydrase 1, mitochondrial isoform X2 [Prosopis cineraria]